MTASMTAFAHVEKSDEQGTFTWEIRTVNQRYLEPHFRLPENYKALEPMLREKIRAELHRGKVECTLQLCTDTNTSTLQINPSMLEQLQQALQQIEKTLPAVSKASAADILQWPGVIEKTENNSENRYPALFKAFDSALSQIKETRYREGEKLHTFILQRIQSIKESVTMLRQHIPEIIENQQHKIKERCQQLKVDVDPARLEQELVLLLQKTDISEELDRIAAHLSEVKRVLNTQGAIGRRLDFLMQELNREANTIGSKSINAVTTQAAVNIKVMIEQGREQVQNIE